MDTFTEKADATLKGKAIALKRTTDGTWHCVFYRGSASGKFDDSIVPEYCVISNKAPNTSFKDIPQKLSTSSKQVFSDKSLTEQIELIDEALQTAKLYADEAQSDGKTLVLTEQEELASPAKKNGLILKKMILPT